MTRRIARLDQALARHVERGTTKGALALVHRRGEEIACFGHGLARDAIVRIASMTKPIVAAAALTFVEEGRIRLYDPLDEHLPELADRKVMKHPFGSRSDLVPSPRPLTLHDLLSLRMGLGWGATSLAQDLFALVAPPVVFPNAVTLAPDAWMKRLGELPLAAPPGTRWLYHTPYDVLGVLLARLAGKPLEDVLRERILDPLGMHDTSFVLPAEKQARLAALWAESPEGLVLRERPEETRWRAPPVFPSGGGGLLGTADDFSRFTRMLLGGGVLEGRRVLSRASLAAMATDTLAPEEHDMPFSAFDCYDVDRQQLWTNRGYGLGVSVRTRRVGLGPNVGSLWWPGAFGTTWLVDPVEELSICLLDQTVRANPLYTLLAEDAVTAIYQALDD